MDGFLLLLSACHEGADSTFRSVRTEITCNNSLFSVRTDGNLQLNFTIFRPYGRKSRAEFRYFPSVQTDGATLLPKVIAQTK